MNITNQNKTNLSLNIGTLVALIITLVAGGIIASDMYSIVQRLDKQTSATGDAVNQTISQLLELSQTNNIRGNDSIMLFKTLLENQIEQGNQTIQNQQKYFPLFNESLGKIFNVLNATEINILSNLTKHRIVSNSTHDQIHALITNLTKQIINQTTSR